MQNRNRTSISRLASVSLFLIISLVAWLPRGLADDEPAIRFRTTADTVEIHIGDQNVATYVFRDPKVPRPYFAHVRTIGGIQVTRNHPPQKDVDQTDHEGLHAGLWLSFGDLNGHDYWRLKAATNHVQFLAEPQVGDKRCGFTVLNRYMATDGKTAVCEESCDYTVRLVSGGYQITANSEFRPIENGLVFGDQEEMGFGIRVASALAVDRRQGGRILDSAGRINGEQVWGKTADWCDYSGPLHGRWAGITVLTSPENFRPSWSHARNYGFVAMNPFGRKAFTGGESSRIVVQPKETLRLKYAVVIHETAAEADYSPADAWKSWLPE